MFRKLKSQHRTRLVTAISMALLALCPLTSKAEQLLVGMDMPSKLPNGVSGKQISFISADPKTFEQIIEHLPLEPVKLTGWLYQPSIPGTGTVIIVPGSAGISSSYLSYANSLTSTGLAVFVIDSFTGRGISSTTSNQTQLPFAASSYDVLAAFKALLTVPEIDPKRMGAVGFSRGGSAVLLSATSVVRTAVLGSDLAFRSVMAAWPWCGYQFTKPVTRPTSVRFLVGDHDNWVSPIQCQALASAMRSAGQVVSFRMFRDAQHGFGMDSEVHEEPAAIKAFDAPIVYLDDQGRFFDWYSQELLPRADDGYWQKAALPWLAKGAVVGSKPGQRDAFLADMRAYFEETLQR